MSDWGEKARARFDPGDYATPLATYLGGANDLRNHLLSDEAVERAAQAIYESAPSTWSWTWEQIVDGWKNKPYPDYPHLVDDMRRQARAALTAATGEDECDE